MTGTPTEQMPKQVAPHFLFRPLLVVFTEAARTTDRQQIAKEGLFGCTDSRSGEQDVWEAIDIRVLYRTDSEQGGSTAAKQSHALEDVAAAMGTPYPEAVSMMVGDSGWASEGDDNFLNSSVRLKATVGLPCIPTLCSAEAAPEPWKFTALAAGSLPKPVHLVNHVGQLLTGAVRALYRTLPTLGDNKLAVSAVELREQAHRDATVEMLAAMGAPKLLGTNSPELAALQRLVFPISATAPSMRFVKCLNAGKSGAKVAVLEVEGEAPVVVKIGTPLALQSELYGYSTVMDRKLRTGVGANALYGQGRNGLVMAQVVPSDASQVDGSSKDAVGTWYGLLAYAYAGPPTRDTQLRSLGDQVRNALKDAKRRDEVLDSLKHTLDSTIAVLHHGARAQRRTLWQSFGQVLPPLLAMRVNQSSELQTCAVVMTFEEGADKSWYAADAAQFRAAASVAEQANVAAQKPLIHLRRMSLHDLEGSGLEGTKPSAQLRHPRLGMRIQVQFVPSLQAHCDSHAAPITTTLAAQWANRPWIRRGCRFDVAGEAVSCHEVLRRDELDRLRTPAAGSGMAWGARHVFLTGSMTTSTQSGEGARQQHDNSDTPPKGVDTAHALRLIDITFQTAVGATHGDLNLENIMFSAQDKTGWLIDFEHSRNDGAIAYDYAKLIVETINHHLLPQIDDVCGVVSRPAFSPSNPDSGKLFSSMATMLLETIADSMAIDMERGQISTLAQHKITLAVRKGVDLERPLILLDDYEKPTLPGGIAFLLEVIATLLRAARAALKAAYNNDQAALANRDLARAIGAYAFASKKFKKGPALSSHRAALETLATRCLQIGIPGLAALFAGGGSGVPNASDPHAFLMYWLNSRSTTKENSSSYTGETPAESATSASDSHLAAEQNTTAQTQATA